jgi:hypothetical protein
MSLVNQTQRPSPYAAGRTAQPRRYPVSSPVAPLPAASRARFDRRRAARRDAQAVASWLRELSGRPR